MSNAKAPGTTANGVLPLRSTCCGFPECEEAAVTSAGMCERHRHVSVSGTGSWLEAR